MQGLRFPYSSRMRDRGEDDVRSDSRTTRRTPAFNARIILVREDEEVAHCQPKVCDKKREKDEKYQHLTYQDGLETVTSLPFASVSLDLELSHNDRP